MRDFTFHTPATLPEAFELLDSLRRPARPFAGGTALVDFLKQGLLTAEHFVSLEHLPGLSEHPAGGRRHPPRRPGAPS